MTNGLPFPPAPATSTPSPSNEEVIRGRVQRITYRSDSSGYTVLQLAVPQREGKIVVVGPLTDVKDGMALIVRGSFVEHPKFGRQFRAVGWEEAPPSSPEGIERYLGSGLLKGIGQKTAERLVQAFGEKTLEVLLREPHRAAVLPGVGKKKAALLSEALQKRETHREIIRFLVEHAVPQGLAQRIIDTYQAETVEILKKDPYRLCREMRGVGFLTADSVAMRVGLSATAPARIEAGVSYALERGAEDGHCYLTATQLSERTRQLLRIEELPDLRDALTALSSREEIVIEGEDVYLASLYRAERFVASTLASRVRQMPMAPWLAEVEADRTIAEVEKEMEITLSLEQRRAVIAATRERVLVITGGPGCGKTTLVRALVAVAKRGRRRLKLAAPTGRAAQRLAQVTDREASTIHRLLRVDPITRRFVHGPNDPLPVDLLIVDEASMIDIFLARSLLGAIPPEATIVFVGDRDQLPPVGPGRFFGDLVSTPDITTVSLLHLFRRGEGSAITQFAHAVNGGIVPPIPEPDGETKSDAYFIAKRDPEEIVALVEKLVADQIPKKFSFPLKDIAVLSPSNRGPLGIIALNTVLQARLNPARPELAEEELTHGDSIFRLGDRVCQRVNNYQIDEHGVFNGDLGTIVGVNRRARSLAVELWDGRIITYSEGDLHELMLAYAVTVHRSQGSEIPCVVLVLHDSHYTLLDRQLLYTAMTRAKKLLVIVGSRRALAVAAKRASGSQRQTKLCKRIAEAVVSGIASSE